MLNTDIYGLTDIYVHVLPGCIVPDRVLTSSRKRIQDKFPNP